MTHICVGKLTIIASDNGLSPGRRKAIICTNVGLLSIGPLGTNFNEISIGIQIFSFKKMHFKMSSAKWRPFCLGLNVLNDMGACIVITKRHELPPVKYAISNEAKLRNIMFRWFIPHTDVPLSSNIKGHWRILCQCSISIHAINCSSIHNGAFISKQNI